MKKSRQTIRFCETNMKHTYVKLFWGKELLRRSTEYKTTFPSFRHVCLALFSQYNFVFQARKNERVYQKTMTFVRYGQPLTLSSLCIICCVLSPDIRLHQEIFKVVLSFQ